MQAIGQPLGISHKPGRARVLADANQDALARRPRTRDGARLHLREQLLIDPLRRAAQRELAKRRQIGRRKKVRQCPFGLFRDVDLSFLEPRDQIVGRRSTSSTASARSNTVSGTVSRTRTCVI